MTRVRKAVIPAAGLGTRFLPATKSSPKEMLPVVDKPAIQYVVEEAVRAGLDRHLDHHRAGTSARSKTTSTATSSSSTSSTTRASTTCLKEVQFASDLADIHYVRQRDPLGLGHAVSVARHHVGDEPFAVLLADDIMVDDGALLALDARRARALRPVVRRVHGSAAGGDLVVRLCRPDAESRRMRPCRARTWSRSGASSRSRRATRRRRTSRSSVATCSRPRSSRCSTASSRDAAASCNSPTRSRCCSSTRACSAPTAGTGRYDVGQKIDFLRANVELALDRTDLGPAFGEWLREYVADRWPV